jgi:hypothetical protein
LKFVPLIVTERSPRISASGTMEVNVGAGGLPTTISSPRYGM